MKEVYLDRTEKDNSIWLSLIGTAIKTAKLFEIHCWNEEAEWIEFALNYGTLKESTWRYGKIIEGKVTSEFVDMILGMPKPQDVEIYNKMTPFFNVFLDDIFQSCHYGTEIFIERKMNKRLYVSYADITDFLMQGREIEFVYNGRECAITNHTKRWWFYDGEEQIEICEFGNLILLVNIISECVVEDKTVRDIFVDGLYEDVCIL